VQDEIADNSDYEYPCNITAKKFEMFVDLQLKTDYFLENGKHCQRDTSCTRVCLYLSVFLMTAHRLVEYLEMKFEEGDMTEGVYLEEMNDCKKIHELQCVSIFNCPLIVHKDYVQIFMLTEDQCNDLLYDIMTNENV
jgi:hypothetical protein